VAETLLTEAYLLVDDDHQSKGTGLRLNAVSRANKAAAMPPLLERLLANYKENKRWLAQLIRSKGIHCFEVNDLRPALSTHTRRQSSALLIGHVQAV